MKLKRVRIFGFKTFADKTEFDLDGDIIAIVGPNGCGKSNIVDSILWGLGEHNARNLRAQSSQEVIFAGSNLRKPLGYAEVTLHFDNEDGTLPVESPEVAVTRKLNRAGDSDYAINRRACRLRDVVDLLADTGLGRAGYAIVGQSEIDQALAASPQQRRGWLDEAAGVQRYRARRTESLRRLESAASHLERVHDILNEIESQRKPLEVEAEAARRYKTASGALREVECGLLVKEVATAAAEIEEIGARVDASMKLARDEAEQAEELEHEAKVCAEAAARLDAEIEAIRTRMQGATTNLEHARAAVQVAQARLESLGELETSLAGEAVEVTQRVESARADLARAQAEEAAETEALEKLRIELSGADEEAKSLTATLAKVEQELAAERSKLAQKQRLELEAAHRADRIAQVQEELEGIDASMPDLAEAVAEAEKEAGVHTQACAATRDAIAKADRGLRELTAREEKAGADGRKLLAEAAALDGKRRGIEATIDAHEGLAQGARAVMVAVDQGLLEGSYVPLGSAITVRPEYALALDTALGAAANDLIVPDEGYAKRAIQMLKEKRLGRATFQPVPLMRPPSVSPDLRDVLRDKGVVGLASELVECKAAHRPVVDSVLGRVVIAEDLDASLRLARTRGWSRIVTLEGEVVHSSGAVTGGATSRQGSGLVQRQAELGEVASKLQALQRDLAGINAAQKAREEERAKLRAQTEELRKCLETQGQDEREARAWLGNLRQEMQSAERSREKLQLELDALKIVGDPESITADVSGVEARRDEVLKALAARSADADQAAERLDEAETREQNAVRRRAESERRLNAALSAASARERRAQNLEPERKRLAEAIAQAERSQGVAETEVEAARVKLAEKMEARKAKHEEEYKLAEQAKAAQKNSANCAEAAHEGELKRARADSRRASALQRLLEEYGVTQEEALELAPDTEVPEDAPAMVSRLRRELKAMGEVNLGAIEAYERLTERYEQLTGQSEDIERGKAEIESGMRELDRLTRERFGTTFAKVQEAFVEMFVSIFRGGEAKLSLSEPENLLDSGVEIEVTIPGKKRQRLDLLSGGERALSALAFLFALLKVKPSPLVVLDEVDAPLDGVNVERFIAMLRLFRETTQFIVITHNPVTIESADVWLGVTMQEPGVTTLVPFKAPGKELVLDGAAVVGTGAEALANLDAAAQSKN